MFRAFFRIRTKLLLSNLLLVIVPIAGLSFARTFERELLRSEEEGMVLAATMLAQTASDTENVKLAATSAAATLHAQIRIVNHEGMTTLDTGAPEVEKITRGRDLLSVDLRSLSGPSRVRVADVARDDGSLRDRPEIARALAGESGRATRTAAGLRSVLLYVAEPIHAPSGEVTGAIYVTRSTYPVLVSLYRVRNFLVRVLVVSSVFALAIAMFFAFTISRPLGKLTDAAGRIASGERGVSLKLSDRDEVGDLARAFDRMARELDARLDYVSELSANVSHEFKTPLASLKGASELLLDGAADDPIMRTKFLGNIASDVDRLSRLVSRLLELGRVEARHLPGVPLDYRALVEAAVARTRDAGKEVRLSYEAEHAHLVGHADHLETLLENLLENASRYSPTDEAIDVRVTEDHGELRTEITDHGIGISQANLPRIWDRFFTTERARGGTGLGLSIVRAIVETHGGAVSATSKPGEGTTFAFSIPRRL